MGDSSTSKLKLYSFYGSSCAFRVRIALYLKGIDYEYIVVNLSKGEHFSTEFLKLNPLDYVPVLVDGEMTLADSFAILMYLEEKYPQQPLLPKDPNKRAINYQNHIDEKHGSDESVHWAQSHINKGFAALEKLLVKYAGKYATGDEVFLTWTGYPHLSRVYKAY